MRRGSGTLRCQSKLLIAFGCGNLDGNKRRRIIYCTAPPPSRIDRTRPSKAVCGSGVLATVGAMRTSATAGAARAIWSGRTASLNLSSRGWIAQFASGSVWSKLPSPDARLPKAKSRFAKSQTSRYVVTWELPCAYSVKTRSRRRSNQFFVQAAQG